jgi:hypothetical protein
VTELALSRRCPYAVEVARGTHVVCGLPAGHTSPCRRPGFGLGDPLEGANCHFCGCTADSFHVADEVWAFVEPILGQHQACFKCFRIAAWHVGLRETWEVSPG